MAQWVNLRCDAQHSQGGKTIEVINTILKYSYVGLLLTCFIIALGNRPQGSNRTYTLAFVGYAIFALYMIVRYRERRFQDEQRREVQRTQLRWPC